MEVFKNKLNVAFILKYFQKDIINLYQMFDNFPCYDDTYTCTLFSNLAIILHNAVK